MAEFPSLPLWTDAYLADTDHLTFEEHGIYLRLLMLIWRNPNCQIPNDKKWICRRLKVSDKYFDLSIVPIMEEYLDNTGNYISQGRLKKEFLFVRERSQKQSARAKSRWNKEKGVCRGSTATGNAPIPIPIRSKKELTKVSSKENSEKTRGSPLPDGWKLNEDNYQFAVNEIGEENVKKQTAQFVDYWIAKPGAGGRKKDWSATWRNWCRRHADFASKSTGTKRSGAGDIFTAMRSVINDGEVHQGLRLDGVQNDGGCEPERSGNGDRSDIVLLPAAVES
tara:strand:+ start:177 stop:1016 length:840 start_codon:yes stop_codon:yes gene_type:complete